MTERTIEDIIQRQCLEEILQIIMNYYRSGGTMEELLKEQAMQRGSSQK